MSTQDLVTQLSVYINNLPAVFSISSGELGRRRMAAISVCKLITEICEEVNANLASNKRLVVIQIGNPHDPLSFGYPVVELSVCLLGSLLPVAYFEIDCSGYSMPALDRGDIISKMQAGLNKICDL